MNRWSIACLAAALTIPSILPAQARDTLTPRAALDSIDHLWSLGHYPEALARMGALLDSPRGPAALEEMALLTGELFQTDSLAPDGREVQWSPDGRDLSYATGTAADRQVHVVDLGNGRRTSTLAGRGLVFSPTSREAAYLGVPETPALAAARVQADSAIQARDFNALRRARATIAQLESEAATIRVRDLRSGREREVAASGLSRRALAWSGDGRTLYLVGGPAGETGRSNIYAVSPAGGRTAPVPVVDAPGARAGLRATPDGRQLIYLEPGNVVVRDLSTDSTRRFPARAFAMAADGSAIAFIRRDSTRNSLMLLPLGGGAAAPRALLTTTDPIDNPALAPDGSRVVFQMMPRENWDLYVVGAEGGEARRITWDVQHDLFPRFLDADRILAVIGEARHRRAHIYDAASGERTRVFHNNTVRTVSAEYEWAASPDGSKVLIVAERDGNTISPERSVFLTDLATRITLDELKARVRASQEAEADLRARGKATFAPIEARVRSAVDAVSVSRIHGYAADLFAFGSKYITQPGNGRAIEYLAEKLREFGYTPEIQWFEPEPGVRSANVVARLAGTSNPELVYTVSSHFDSVEDGPGADDNSSGTTALLEAARVLATQPQAATIEFAFFTGEEAGLYGSREYVRRAVADGKRIVGALNNDMIGFANDERLDNTIRYSNDGLRDLQHAAAFLFTDLVTYDARYYKNTDAHAYYEQYGDIVGGIGSYPILGNPHYHQSHDVLETISQHLVAEVSRTTIASIMAMASAPSRLTGLEVRRSGRGAVAEWQPAPEAGVTGYRVSYGPRSDPDRHQLSVSEARAELPEAAAGSVVAVRAVGSGGLAGWDWVRATIE